MTLEESTSILESQIMVFGQIPVVIGDGPYPAPVPVPPGSSAETVVCYFLALLTYISNLVSCNTITDPELRAGCIKDAYTVYKNQITLCDGAV